MVATMAPGSVVIDISVDQGGCIETTRLTTHSEPTYTVHGVVHYGVPNVPGAVPRTSTYALSNVTLPYVMALAQHGFEAAILADRTLQRGVNTAAGEITHPAVAEALNRPHVPIEKIAAS
jgi:alanine dehydrogenase